MNPAMKPEHEQRVVKHMQRRAGPEHDPETVEAHAKLTRDTQSWIAGGKKGHSPYERMRQRVEARSAAQVAAKDRAKRDTARSSKGKR